ncbi:OmpH family outer membrane protein [Dyadobacter sp. CY323]|uniref:OmpH family outer membrane protein n=1 Tax=Dyadobacter sp. CY323 TaxID=2907302 RepID=UPI001F408D7A|nr:OmpH family outer membrane protein [Dyadobacter sp. CY323]MCE6991220.1 OmpH family outer membrane protein [Dyadobacter sp. CY323]
MKRWTSLSFFVGLLINFQALCQSTGNTGFPKIGYTNIDVVIGRLPESKSMQNQLEITKTQLEKAIDESIREFQGKADNYQKTAGQMTDIIRADKEKELENLQTRIQEMRSKAQFSLQNKQQQLLDPIMTKVNTAIQQVGKENGYVYIFNMDGGAGTVPFILFVATEENNVTNLVLKKLGVDPDQIEAQASPAKPATSPATAAPTKQVTPIKK